ncbi:MAG: hypothetical protein ACAH80_11160 [Alphaproteobacteria bacterium]
MQIAFNTAAQKIVDYDEYKRRRTELENKQFSVGEVLFEAFVDMPSRAALWVGRGFAESYQAIRGRKNADEGGYYYDSFGGDHRKTYFDRGVLESDLAFFGKHGVGTAFQQKSARIARQAFDECQDYSCLVETGQFKKIMA